MLASATNVNPSYYAWDFNINERGAYVSYNATDNINSNPFVSKVDKNIQSGQAVFVQNANGGAASIQFQEG